MPNEDLLKYRQLHTFEMRKTYDEKNEDEQKLIKEDIMYDKQTVMDENASLERILNTYQSSTEMQLPKLSQQKIRERLFSNKSYLLINENSKEDSEYMEHVKTSVRTLQDALNRQFIGSGKDFKEHLDGIMSLYADSIDKCNEYLYRGSEKRHVPFWPWHKKRYNAVDDMEKRLREERDVYAKKLEFFKTVPGSPYQGEGVKESEDSLKLDSIYKSYRIKSAMDVILIDRFNIDEVEEERDYLAGNSQAKGSDNYDTEIPAEFEKMVFLGSILDGSYVKEHAESKYLDFPYLYADHYGISRDDVGTEVIGKNISMLTMADEQTKVARKLLDSDAGQILVWVDALKDGKTELTAFPQLISGLEDILGNIKKYKTVSISPDVVNMGKVLLDQLKLFQKHPAEMLSQMKDSALKHIFGLSISFDKLYHIYRGPHDVNGFTDEEFINEDSIEMPEDYDSEEEIEYDSISRREFIERLINDNRYLRLDLLTPLLLAQHYDHSARDTYYKYVANTSLSTIAQKTIDFASGDYNGMQQT